MPTSYNERIHQLLDGELDSPGEAVLFGELAENSDLRSEFMQLLAIRTAVQQDRAGLVPPIALTNSVFTGLGITAPLAGAAASAAGGAVATSWLTKALLPLTAALAAAGLTYGLMNSAQLGRGEPVARPDNIAAHRAESSAQLGRGEPVARPDNIAVARPDNITNSEQRTANSEQLGRGEPVARPDNITSSEQRTASSENMELRRLRAEVSRLSDALALATITEAEEPAQTQVQDVQEEPAEVPVSTTAIDLTHTIMLARDTDPRVLMPMKEAPIVPEYQDYPSFLVQFRGLASSGLTQVSVAPQTSLMENANLAMMYQLSPQHLIGVEVGNESFPMTFEGMRSGQLIRYEQQPISTWAGITYRHSFAPIGNSAFTPFAQGLLGGSQFGPLGRLTGGILYSPAGPLSFMLGVEGTSMAYTFQDQWFTSSKLGLTYGMAIRF
jgi:hypothetical protein